MAVELCPDNSGITMSPRYSFSHDLSQTDNNILPIEQQRRPSLDSITSLEFDFNIRESSIIDQDSSSADELFSDGMIRSVQIKKEIVKTTKQTNQYRSNSSRPAPRPLPPPTALDHDFKAMSLSEAEDQKQNSKSFWRFKRSSSLNCGSGYARSLCPLPLLSRSSSTGSAASSVAKKNQKPNSNNNNNSQKPPLKKSSYGSYGSSSNGVHINPVLHVSSASLFGFGSIFSNSKVKNKNR